MAHHAGFWSSRENSLLYAQALRKAGVPFELHIYEKGPHGIGLDQGHPWVAEALRWVDTLGVSYPLMKAR